MDVVNSIVENVLGSAAILGGNTDVVLFILVFSTVFLAVLGVFGVWYSKNPVQRRLEGKTAQVAAGPAADVSIRYSEETPLDKIAKPFEKHFLPSSEDLRHRIRRRMVQAGYLRPVAVRVYFTSRLILGLGLPFVYTVLAPLFTKNLTVEEVLLFALLFAMLGLFLPWLWIAQRIRLRQRAVREAFPDALDMMLVCVEAGLGLDAALNRVGNEIGRAYPVLAEQLRLVGLELRAGKSREDALRNFADRVGTQEVQSLVALLIQSEALGTSIAQALRVHADDMRNKRILLAEEKAHKLPVKLSVPLVLFVLPALIIVVLSPAIIRMSRELVPILSRSMQSAPGL
ncbi:MAG: type II secretion system F family protein [Alphaproteobacteria bacterium]